MKETREVLEPDLESTYQKKKHSGKQINAIIQDFEYGINLDFFLTKLQQDMVHNLYKIWYKPNEN